MTSSTQTFACDFRLKKEQPTQIMLTFATSKRQQTSYKSRIKEKTNYLKLSAMSKKFVIGDRVKDEWISVLDTEKRKLEFTNHLASAKEFKDEATAKAQLKELQTTGYFTDLQIYIQDNNKAYKPDERDAFQS